MDNTYCFLYVTTANIKEAEMIGTELVSSQLAACINIIDQIHSIYHWQGKICKEKECILIAKTKTSLAKESISLIKTIHSYSCPCIVAVPIFDGADTFLEWINKQTRNATTQ